MGSYGSDNFYPTFDKKSKTTSSTENCRQRSATLLQSPNGNVTANERTLGEGGVKK